MAAVGDKADNALYRELEGKVPELYNIGDSAKPDSIAASVSQGYYCGLGL